MTKVNLTQFTKAGGCGCKLSPKILSTIIKSVKIMSNETNLIAGNFDHEDAAVIKLSKTKALVFTDDFFTPIVEDPFWFGKIAACNALSDIYAMGAKPQVALSILGWPIDKIPARYARRVLEGAQSVCERAGVSLAGGHSIDNPQPIFGLSVVGYINPKYLKLNRSAKEGDVIFLTKPLGTGIYSTALKLNKIEPRDRTEVMKVMSTLNDLGIEIAKLDYVNSMTDVTGFGLFGHLLEICKASNLRAEIVVDKIPFLKNAPLYYERGIQTSGGRRNWESYRNLVDVRDEFKQVILSDPQTNGGLLITVDQRQQNRFELFMRRKGLLEFSSPIGIMKSNNGTSNKIIAVK